MPYKISTKDLELPRSNFMDQEEALDHPIYNFIPRHRKQVYWYDVGHLLSWGLFGNDDDGLFGENDPACYRQDLQPSLKKASLWFLRNPLHNFCFYVIGSADRKNDEWTLLQINHEGIKSLQYKEIADTVFAGKGSSFYFGLHGLKPFISLSIRYSKEKCGQFYIGWRERGNFGIKCRPLTKILIE